MPLLDVSDVLDDPDLFDTFIVKRAPITVTTGGIAVLQTDPDPEETTGVVTPANAAQLQLLPEGTLQQGAIQIITRYRLRTGSGTNYGPDIVEWHGADYQVMVSNDWSGFGSGFIQAVAVLRTVNPVNG